MWAWNHIPALRNNRNYPHTNPCWLNDRFCSGSHDDSPEMMPWYNIEIKSLPRNGRRIPPRARRVRWSCDEHPGRKGLEERVVIQSFDIRPRCRSFTEIPGLQHHCSLMKTIRKPAGTTRPTWFYSIHIFTALFQLLSDKGSNECHAKGVVSYPGRSMGGHGGELEENGADGDHGLSWPLQIIIPELFPFQARALRENSFPAGPIELHGFDQFPAVLA